MKPDLYVEGSKCTGINKEHFAALVSEELAALIRNNSACFKFHFLLKNSFMIKIIHHTGNNCFHRQDNHFYSFLSCCYCLYC